MKHTRNEGNGGWLVLGAVFLVLACASAGAADKVWGDFTGAVVQSGSRNNAKFWANTNINASPVNDTGGHLTENFRDSSAAPVDAQVWSPNGPNLANPGRYLVLRFDLDCGAYAQDAVEFSFEYQSGGGNLDGRRKRWFYVAPNQGMQTVIIDLENPATWETGAAPAPEANITKHFAFQDHEDWGPYSLVQYALRVGWWWSGNDKDELAHAGNSCRFDLIAIVDDFTPYIPYAPRVYADYFVGLHQNDVSGNSQVWRLYYSDEPRAQWPGDLYVTADKKEVCSTLYPRIGPYDNLDPAVAEYQVLSAKAAGISGFMCEWQKAYDYVGGQPVLNPSATTIKDLGDVGRRYDFTVGVNWTLDVVFDWYTFATRQEYLDQMTTDIIYMLNEVYEARNGPFINGRPLVPIWGLNAMDAGASITNKWLDPQELADMRSAIMAAGLPNPWILSTHRDGHTLSSGLLGHVDGFYAWHTVFSDSVALWPWNYFTDRAKQTAFLNDFYRNCDAKWNSGQIGMFMGSFTSRFDSHKGLSWGAGIMIGVPDDGGLTLTDTLAQFNTSTEARLLMATTWNDQEEATIIEPCREYGFRDLDSIQQSLWTINGWGTADSALLRLPERLYDARKAITLLKDAGVPAGAPDLVSAVAHADAAGQHIAARERIAATTSLDNAEAKINTLKAGLDTHYIDVSWEYGAPANGILLQWPATVSETWQIDGKSGIKLGSSIGRKAGFVVDALTQAKLQGHKFVGTLTIEYLDAVDTSYVNVRGDNDNPALRRIASFQKKNSGKWRLHQMDLVNTDFNHALAGYDIEVAQGSGTTGGIRMVRLEGISYRTGPGTDDLARTGGQIDWATQVSGAEGQFPYDIAMLADGSAVIVTGEFWGTTTFAGHPPVTAEGESDLFVAKFRTSDGACQWVTTGGGLYSDRGVNATIAQDGSITVKGTGFGRVYFAGPSQYLDCSIESAFDARYDANGNYIAGSAVVDPYANYDAPVRQIALPGQGKVMAGKFTHSLPLGVGEPNATLLRGALGDDIFVACFSADGALNWADAVGGDGDDWPTGMAAMPDGSGFILIGCFEQDIQFGGLPQRVSAGNADMFIARYSAEPQRDPIAGDVNQDGRVDALDVQILINAALGFSVERPTDLDYSGATNAVDVQLVINAALGKVIDTDNDGLADGFETNYGTSPTDYDTDHDGIGDGREFMNS